MQAHTSLDDVESRRCSRKRVEAGRGGVGHNPSSIRLAGAWVREDPGATANYSTIRNNASKRAKSSRVEEIVRVMRVVPELAQASEGVAGGAWR